MRRVIALVLVVAMIVGVGPAMGRAFAGEREYNFGPVTVVTRPGVRAENEACLTLTELHKLRQNVATRAALSANPAATYRAELRRTQDTLAVQQRDCLIGLRVALAGEEGYKLVRLAEGYTGGGDPGVGVGDPNPGDAAALEAINRGWDAVGRLVGGNIGTATGIAVGRAFVSRGLSTGNQDLINLGVAILGGSIALTLDQINKAFGNLFGGGGGGGGGGNGGGSSGGVQTAAERVPKGEGEAVSSLASTWMTQAICP